MSIEDKIESIFQWVQVIGCISIIFIIALFLGLICLFIYYCQQEAKDKEDELIRRIRKEINNNGKS